MNPSFIQDLTATPRNNSNILCYVDARELKKEHMVKLPVAVYNRTTHQSVIQDAVQLRGSIEQQAIAQEEAGGEYIRPIVLFQAHPNIKGKENDFICVQINRNNRYAASDINGYVYRIVENMTEDEIAAMETAIPVYAKRFRIDKKEKCL